MSCKINQNNASKRFKIFQVQFTSQNVTNISKISHIPAPLLDRSGVQLLYLVAAALLAPAADATSLRPRCWELLGTVTASRSSNLSQKFGSVATAAFKNYQIVLFRDDIKFMIVQSYCLPQSSPRLRRRSPRALNAHSGSHTSPGRSARNHAALLVAAQIFP